MRKVVKPPSSERTLAPYVAAHARETGADVAPRHARLAAVHLGAGQLGRSVRPDG